MAAFLDPSERDKIDSVLRLPHLNFPKSTPVLGKKNIDLMIALGAIDTKRSRAGKQHLVVRRLTIFYEAVLHIHKENPSLDIFSDRFYSAALLSISDKYRDVSKHLTPQSLRHVIEVYRKAFVRSGGKVISKPSKNPNEEQMDGSTKSDAAQSDGDRGEKLVGEDTFKESTENLEPMGDRARLEKLVKEWMVARGIAREATSADEKPKLEFILKDIEFPPQKPDESVDAYMLRLQHEFQELYREKHADNFVLSYVSDQRRVRLDQQSNEIEGYKKLSEQRRQRLDQQFDEIQELKKRNAAMQHDLDTHADVFGRQDDVINRQNQLNDKLNEAIGLQVIILKLELAIILRQDRLGYRQDAILRRQDAIMDGQDAIIDGQDAIMRGQDKIMYNQGYINTTVNEIIAEQDKVMQRQDQALARAVETMDRQREALARQVDERRRRTRALQSVGITPEGLDEGLLVFPPGFQPGRFPESYERSTGPRGL